MRIVRATLIVLAAGSQASTLAVSAQAPLTQGWSVGGGLIASPSFSLRYEPGTYSHAGISYTLTEHSANVGDSKTHVGAAIAVGYGFSPWFGVYAGADGGGGGFQFGNFTPDSMVQGQRTKQSSTQFSMYVGGRLNLAIPNAPVIPYVTGSIGYASVVTDVGYDTQIIGPGGAQFSGVTTYAGQTIGFGVGAQAGQWRVGTKGHFSIDAHYESRIAALDGDQGGGEKLKDVKMSRILVGGIWWFDLRAK